MLRTYFLILSILALAGILLGWNVSRFVGAKAVIKTKELAFLPGPTTARILALGQAATAAKLRWIDSFQFQQLVIDRKDDRLPDGSSVFVRLYDTLIPLDPLYVPFYQNAVLNLGGILERHGEELRYTGLGIHNLPNETIIRRMFAACLVAFYDFEARQPEVLDAVLADWAAHEASPQGRDQVWRWQQMMGRRAFDGLEQVPYWLDQLEHTTPGTSSAEFVESALREQLATYAQRAMSAALKELPQVVSLPNLQDDTWHILAKPIAERIAALPATKVPPAGALPIVRDQAGRWSLRYDPWGWPWMRLNDGSFYPGGEFRRDFRGTLSRANQELLTAVKKAGRWPTSLAEVAELGITVPGPTPAGGTVRLAGQVLVVEWTDPPEKPWPLRAGP